MTDAVLLGAAIASLLLTALSAIGARSLRSFSRTKLQELAHQRGTPLELISQIQTDYERVALAVENLRVIMTAVAASTGSLWIWSHWGVAGEANWPLLIAASIIGGFLVLAAAIWIPYAVGTLWAETFLLRTWSLWRFVSQLLTPFVFLAGLISKGLHKAAGQTHGATEESVEEAIRTIVSEGHRGGLLEEDAREMIESVIELHDVEASEIMTPRTYMISMHVDTPWAEALQLVIDAGHTRIPVYDNNRDDIIGILYIKDLLPELAKPPGERKAVREILRKPYFVPDTKPVDELLREFQRSRNHIAIVLDEFGGVSGLVSIEDVLEEIVGEIADEYDEDLIDGIKCSDDGRCEAHARVPLHEINERLGLSLPEDADFDTLGGFIFHELGHIPAVGEELVWGEIRFRVLDATRRRIDRVAIEVLRKAGEVGSG